MTTNKATELLGWFADLIKMEYEAAKVRYPDLDQIIAAAELLDPDVGYLDVIAYLGNGVPTHFSRAIDEYLRNKEAHS